MNHELKTTTAHFQQTIDGTKLFTVRDNTDRGFQKGDALCLREVDPKKVHITGYTGRAINAVITHVSTHNQPQNQVVIGFKPDLGED